MKARPRRSWRSYVALTLRDAVRRHRMLVIRAAALLALAAGGTSLGFSLNQADPAEPAGLQGIWPDFPPRSLSVAQFAKLDERWADWSEAAAIDVANLYSLSGKSVAEQYEVLEKVEQRVETLETALRDPAYSMIRPELTDLRGSLKLRTSLFRAALELLAADAAPDATQAIPEARRDFVDALNHLRRDLNTVPNGSAWFPYLELAALEGAIESGGVPADLDDLAARLDPTAEDLTGAQSAFLKRKSLRDLAEASARYAALIDISENGLNQDALRQALADLIEAIDYHDESPTDETAADIDAAREALRLAAGPAAGPFDQLIRKQFFNYNVRLVADAALVSKLTSVSDITCGPVRDYFMGANIFGQQKTRTSANLHFIPSSGVARFKLVLDGVSNSRTTAYAEKATVASVGQHHFHATKPLSFNGDRFGFGPARVAVNPNIRHTGISTKYDHIFFGLFKGMIRRKAMQRANERLPQGRAHAADELRAKLLPQFNGEVEGNFSELNGTLARFDAELAEENLTPAAERVRTTTDRFLFDAAIRGPSELSGSPPNIGSTRGVGFTLQIHESLLNNAADRWDLAGKSMTEAEVRDILESWFSDLLGRAVSFDDTSGKPSDPSIITFAETDPVRFDIADGDVTLILRAGVETEDGRVVPPQVVEVPLNISVENGKIQFTRGTVRVSPLERPRNRALQITRAGIMRKQIQDSIKDGTQDGSFQVEREGRTPATIQIQRIEAQSGWITVYGT